MLNKFKYYPIIFMFMIILCSNLCGMDEKIEELSTSSQSATLVLRKSVRNLTDYEKKRYVTGVKLLKAEKIEGKLYKNTYDKYVLIHSRQKNMAVAHAAPTFLPWHRNFILQFEKDMQRILKDNAFALPYWDWEWDANQADPLKTPIWDDDFMGGDGQPVSSGPFTQSQWITTSGEGLSRKRSVHASILPSEDDINQSLIATTYDVGPYNAQSQGGFRNIIEGWLGFKLHNLVHTWIGGDMMMVPTAPNDPIFFLHHCNIDRIWAMWQSQHPNEFDPLKTTYPKIGAAKGTNLYDSMVPWKTTPAQVLDYKTLGYDYDENWTTVSSLTFDNELSRVCISPFLNYLYIVALDSNEHVYISTLIGGSATKPVQPNVDWRASAVSMMIFNNYMFMALVGREHVYLTQTNGTNWVPVFEPNQGWRASDLSFASKENKLYMAIIGNEHIYTVSSFDGQKWSEAKEPNGNWKASSISLINFKNTLFMTYVYNGNVYCTYATDGDNWVDAFQPNKLWNASNVSLSTDKNKLFLSLIGKNNYIYISSSYDGKNWSEGYIPNVNWKAANLSLTDFFNPVPPMEHSQNIAFIDNTSRYSVKIVRG
ncbi:MAG: tyrosinase family protein [Alphaproteobacteria bacterium]|nr:tyrosinase family protein [Alphaproteobacteria bacterium]